MIINEMYIWILGTAVLFTAVGWVWGKRNTVELVVASTIDSLISDGYLKTQGTGKDMVILKWQDWDNDKTD